MCAEMQPLTPEELTAAGEALFGPGWRRAMAAELGINNEGKIARMAEGRHQIPMGFRSELADLAQKKIERIAAMQAALTGK